METGNTEIAPLKPNEFQRLCRNARAKTLTDRFLDPETPPRERENPHAEVRALVLKYRREFEAEGDPYPRDILAVGGWE